MDKRHLPGESHRAFNGAASAARANESVAHGRAHLDHQRRISTPGVYRDAAEMMRHNTKSTT